MEGRRPPGRQGPRTRHALSEPSQRFQGLHARDADIRFQLEARDEKIHQEAGEQVGSKVLLDHE